MSAAVKADPPVSSRAARVSQLKKMMRPAAFVAAVLLPVCGAAFAAGGFRVVGLQNLAIRTNSPMDINSALWMGDRIGSSGGVPEWIRVDLDGVLVLQWGDDILKGSLIECSEYSFLAATDTGIHLLSGRARIVVGDLSFAADSQAGGGSADAFIPISTAFGLCRVMPNTIALIEIDGRRATLFCLFGRSDLRLTPSSPPIDIPAGSMLQLTSRDLENPAAPPRARPTPPEMRAALEARRAFPLRYAHGAGPASPRVRWFEPRPGKILDRDAADIRGRIDPSGGPVQVTAAGKTVTVDPSGFFSSTISVRSVPDSLTLKFRQSASEATLSIRLDADFKPPVCQIDPQPETSTLPEIVVSGRVSEAALVFVDGKAVPSSNFQFSQIVPLSPGPNRIAIKVVDRAGNSYDTELNVNSSAAISEARRAQRSVDSPAPGYGTAASSPAPPRVARSGRSGSAFSIEMERHPPTRGQYRIFRSYSKDGPYAVADEIDGIEYVDQSSFQSGLVYYYRVTTVSAEGDESLASDVIVFAPEHQSLSAPAPLSVKIESGQFRIFWPRDATGAIAGYNIYRVTGTDTARVASIASPPYVSMLPDTAVDWWFRVAAVSAYTKDESALSDSVWVRR